MAPSLVSTRLSTQDRRSSEKRSHVVKLLLCAAMASTLGGCAAYNTVYDYLNPANSFMDPSQVGRFDKGHPWGTATPVKWPILETLDVVDEPLDPHANATDPTPADLVEDKSEYIVGAGDVLRLSVWELVTPQMEYVRDSIPVSESGNITVQNLGSVKVAGLTTLQIEEKIGQLAVERNLILPRGNGNPGPQVAVTLLQSQSRVFSILGGVTQQGTYSILSSDFRLLNALALARDITGGYQPGMDYLYIIRRMPVAAAPAVGTTTAGSADPSTPSQPAVNPLNTLEGIEKNANTQTAPATQQSKAILPHRYASIPTADAAPSETAPRASQADLDAALNPQTTPRATTAPKSDELLNRAITPAAGRTGQYVFIDGKWVLIPGTATQPKTAPAIAATTPAPAPTASTPAPAEPGTVAVSPTTVPATETVSTAPMQTPTPTPAAPAATDTASTTSAPAPTDTAPSSEPAVAASPATVPSTVPAAETPAFTMPSGVASRIPVTSAPSGMSPAESAAIATEMGSQRVIRIPIAALREGNSKYNVMIRPGDVIEVPTIQNTIYYVGGHVNRPGVYTLGGNKVTLEGAIMAAGNLDALAIPRRCDLVRRLGPNQQVIVQVNLQAIFAGDQPDIFIKPNDVINVGTDLVAPFLAVTRNAYRASYGFGFIYDRNYYIQPTRLE